MFSILVENYWTAKFTAPVLKYVLEKVKSAHLRIYAALGWNVALLVVRVNVLNLVLKKVASAIQKLCVVVETFAKVAYARGHVLSKVKARAY